MSNEGRFTKIGPSGEKLPADVAAWEAVLDTTTGLMWSVKEPKAMPWKKAIEWAKKLKQPRPCTICKMPALFSRWVQVSYMRGDDDLYPICESCWALRDRTDLDHCDVATRLLEQGTNPGGDA